MAYAPAAARVHGREVQRLTTPSDQAFGCGGEPVVEREDAAPASCAASSTQQSGSFRFVSARSIASRDAASAARGISSLRGGDRRTATLQPAALRRADEDLGERDRAAPERLAGANSSALDRPLVLRVARVQMRDKHARVDDDHAGQSSRSRSR